MAGNHSSHLILISRKRQTKQLRFRQSHCVQNISFKFVTGTAAPRLQIEILSREFRKGRQEPRHEQEASKVI